MTRTPYEIVAEQTGLDESTVRFIWRNYCQYLQRYMSSPIYPEILMKHFGKFQLSAKDIDKKRFSHRHMVQSEYRNKLRELSLKLTLNKKYVDNDEFNSRLCPEPSGEV